MTIEQAVYDRLHELGIPFTVHGHPPVVTVDDAEAHCVLVAVDRDLKATERVSFHPNINTLTLTISRADFEKFLKASGNPVQYVRV